MTLDAHLKSMGFTQSTADPCIYTSGAEGDVFHVGVYVDDMYTLTSTLGFPLLIAW